MSLWLSQSSLMRPELPRWLEELCRRLRENDPQLARLELTHQRINDSQARELAMAMTHNTNVVALLLSCFSLVDDGAWNMAETVRRSSVIECLQLRDLRNRRETDVFLHAISKNKSIRDLSFRHCQITADSQQQLYGVLVNHPSIVELRFVDVQFAEDAMRSLFRGIQAAEPSLRRLFLVNAELGGNATNTSGSIVALSKMLQLNVSLQELNLCENGLDDTDTARIAAGLSQNTTLKLLDLRSNEIAYDGAARLAEALQNSNNAVQSLSLASNCIGNAGLKTLCTCMQSKKCSILSLDISDNCIDEEGGKELARMLRGNQIVQTLNVSFNRLGDVGTEALADALTTNTTLRKLIMRRSHVGDAGVVAVAARLPAMHGLRELSIVRNEISKEGSHALLMGVRRNMELQHLNVDDQVPGHVLSEILHWMRLNRAGRRVFRDSCLPLSVWPRILSRINSDADTDILYHFLTEKPCMLRRVRCEH